jgi:hypothetical protein
MGINTTVTERLTALRARAAESRGPSRRKEAPARYSGDVLSARLRALPIKR